MKTNTSDLNKRKLYRKEWQNIDESYARRTKGPTYITNMSDVISKYMQRSYEWKIFVPDPPLSYIKQAVNISYLLLKIKYENVQYGCDYIDFLKALVKISHSKHSTQWTNIYWGSGKEPSSHKRGAFRLDLYSLEILPPFKSRKPREININQNET